MKRLFLSAISVAALTACGGGNSNDSGGGSSATTGQISGITGLGYETASQSGVINQNNEFNFKDGETITLFLGGAELASAPVQLSMTLMDFFPTLPSDAAELRQALRLPEYAREVLQTASRSSSTSRYTQTSSDLYTASNIMRLLVALDEDGDSSNGLDLTSGNWHTKLANETASSLNLESNMFDFANSQAMLNFQDTYAHSINMDVAEPLAVLYDLSQVTISANRLSGYTTPNLSPSETMVYEYDAQQRIVKQTSTSSSTPTKSRVITFEYDAKGNLIKDFNEYGSNTDATLNTFYRKTYTYNAFGKRLSSTQDYDQNAGGDFRRNIYDTTYLNDRVFPTIFMEKEDYRGDGTFDDFGKTTNTYDANNLLTSSLNQTVDENGNPVSTSIRYVYEYNDKQQVTRQDYETSFSGDTAQSITRNDYTYAGNTITDTETNISLNAPMGSNTYKEVFVETLNDAGHITKKTKAEYINNTLDAYGEVDYTSDSNERITQCLYSIDNTGDEQFDYATKKLKGYDANGVTSISYQNDYDNDGVFADDETYAASYGSQGELLSEDSDNRLFSYSGTTNDGVRYLVHEYLDITREVFLRNFSICHLDVSSAK